MRKLQKNFFSVNQDQCTKSKKELHMADKFQCYFVSILKYYGVVLSRIPEAEGKLRYSKQIPFEVNVFWQVVSQYTLKNPVQDILIPCFRKRKC